MSGNLDWKGCKDLMYAKAISPDPNLIKYLLESSQDRQNTAKMLPINETTKESIISLLYDSLRELLEVLAIKHGYKIYNHECYTQFLKSVIKNDGLAYEFDSARLLRNRLNYYGKKIPIQDAKSRIADFDMLISKVRDLIKNNMDRILVFGDSIAWGAWDKNGGWVQRLRQNFEENNDYKFIVYNLGASDQGTTELLERLEFEIVHRTPKGKGLTIIFEIGINDARWLEDKKTFKTPEKTFRKNIERLIKISQKRTSKILFLGLTPVKESKTTPIPWNNNQFYFNKDIQKYDKIIKEVCRKSNISFLEIFSRFEKSKKLGLLEDLHPNSTGHELIFKAVKRELEKNKTLLKNQ